MAQDVRTDNDDRSFYNNSALHIIVYRNKFWSEIIGIASTFSIYVMYYVICFHL